MNCKCREETNDRLKSMNLRLVGYTHLMPSFEVVPQIKTEWIDTKIAPKGKKKSPPAMIANYCPFCGLSAKSTN